MSPSSHQEKIGNLLKGIGNPNTAAADRYGKLRQLFWSELSYRRVDQPLSSRQWPESAKSVIASDPVLFATDAHDKDFHVIYSRLASDRLLYEPEQAVVSQLLKDHPYSLFIFSNSDQSRWHFLNVKESNLEQARRRYRRITVGPEEQLRTATERLSMLDVSEDADWIQGLGRPPAALDLQQRLDEAFDVEAVTKKFFEVYRDIFERVEDLIQGFKDEDQLRFFTQRLFNRMMFIKFIQKKGWLEINGRKDYLAALWNSYKRGASRKDNFYRDRLKSLFFKGLNTQDEKKDAALRELIGKVPYLNGGLFEEDGDDRRSGIEVPDECFSIVFNELFERFNFTVTESTPLNTEVAVDPEMLGKVFEELVTWRHESGSYYTPKSIVSFMCREALKSHLGTSLPGEPTESIALFVDAHDPSKLHKPENVLEVLRRVKVCDPACGSGAYLLGMLHELLDLRQSLFAATELDPLTTYERKLEIIQNNLYGVDLDPFAVNIARLRLWLSLAVDYEGDVPQPLPNLDFKIEVGDSLMAPDPSGGLQPDMFRKSQVDEYFRLKTEYLKAHGSEKGVLREQVDALRKEIAAWAHPKVKQSGFDWAVEFAEVFSPELASEVTWKGSFGFMNEVSGQQTFVEGADARQGGFDVILANPPYVRMELFKDAKPVLRKNFPHVHSDRADLYVYFFARAHELLKPGGVSCFISSNKWLRAGYGENLRQHLLDAQAFPLVVDFGELPVFTAATFPAIFLWRKEARGDTSTAWAAVKDLDACYAEGIREHVSRISKVVPAGQFGKGKSRLKASSAAERRVKMETSGKRLGELVGGQICMGVKTGLNNAFVIDEQTRKALTREDPKSTEIIKPLLKGDDVRRYEIHFRGSYLIYTRHGVDIRRYPAVQRHLRSFRQKLEARATQQEWYELQQPQAGYISFFEGSKIIYPDIGKVTRFAMDLKGYYGTNTTYFIARADWYLLAVLNSALSFEYLKGTCAALGDEEEGGRLRFFGQYLETLPIPDAPAPERKMLGSLAKDAQDLRTKRRTLVEKFLGEIGSSPAQSTSRNPLEQPWTISVDEFTRRSRGATLRYFERAKEESLHLTEEIAGIEKDIDERVAQLYGVGLDHGESV